MNQAHHFYHFCCTKYGEWLNFYLVQDQSLRLQALANWDTHF